MNEQNSVKKEQPGWRKFLARRWMFPVLYMVVAGLMLSMLWVYQGQINNKQTAEQQQSLVVSKSDEKNREQSSAMQPDNQMSKDVSKSLDTMIWPYEQAQEIQIVMPFYDSTAPVAEREKALVKYERSYMPHTGIDFARKDQQTFAVRSVLSGKVTKSEKHALHGNIVEVSHENNLISVYNSLADVQVKLNQTVRQGDVLGKAGTNG